jgi:septal ring-binding cell division protein DamX
MAEIKPFASLTSSLLARKGGAQPAMRRPMVDFNAAPAAAEEDLGWNDMGEVAAQPAPPSPLREVGIVPVATPEPVVVEQRRALKRKLAKVKPAPAPITVPAGSKAAFTLRLDAERHLRLRLLSAITHRSAQQLVTQALDALIADHPELADLAGALPGAEARRHHA